MAASDRHLTYFVSDVHLGVCSLDPVFQDKRFSSFLDGLPEETEALYLLGDIFDFWYEYKYVIPRGHTRTLGSLLRLSDSGVKIYFMQGNHDLWSYSYFEKELGIRIPGPQPFITDIADRRFCIGHGDGLCDLTPGFRFIRAIFYSRTAQRLFSIIHPRVAFGFGYRWASHSRKIKSGHEEEYRFDGKNSPICRFAEQFGCARAKAASSEKSDIDYYIFGHFHTPGDADISSGGHLYVLGDWVNAPDCLEFDGTRIRRIQID